MANSNKKYSKRRSINKNRNNYAKKNVLNKQSRLSQKGGDWCETEKQTIIELESDIGKLESVLTTQESIREKAENALGNLPLAFFKGATDYVENHPEYVGLRSIANGAKDTLVSLKGRRQGYSDDNPTLEDKREIQKWEKNVEQSSAQLSKHKTQYESEYLLNPDNLSTLLKPIIADLKTSKYLKTSK